MGSWISTLSLNPRWIEDYGVWTQAVWHIPLYHGSDSRGGSLYPTGVGDFSGEAEQAGPETRSSALGESVSAGVSLRSVTNGNGFRADEETASTEHTPGTERTASRQASISEYGSPAQSCTRHASLNPTEGSLTEPESAPPHQDSDGESYQTLDSAWLFGVGPGPHHLQPQSSHDSLTLNRRRRLGRPRRAPKAKLPLPRMPRKKRRREYRRHYAVLETSSHASSGRGSPARGWIPRSFRAKDAPAPPSTPSSAAVGEYRPNPMFGHGAGSAPYPRWEAVCNVAVLYASADQPAPRASPWYKEIATPIFKGKILRFSACGAGDKPSYGRRTKERL